LLGGNSVRGTVSFTTPRQEARAVSEQRPKLRGHDEKDDDGHARSVRGEIKSKIRSLGSSAPAAAVFAFPLGELARSRSGSQANKQFGSIVPDDATRIEEIKE